jgi:hypothetical protein
MVSAELFKNTIQNFMMDSSKTECRMATLERFLKMEAYINMNFKMARRLEIFDNTFWKKS